VCGTTSTLERVLATLERARAWVHQIGETKWTETELGFGVYREHGDVVVGGALVLEPVVRGEDHHRRHPVREDLAWRLGFGFYL